MSTFFQKETKEAEAKTGLFSHYDRFFSPSLIFFSFCSQRIGTRPSFFRLTFFSLLSRGGLGGLDNGGVEDFRRAASVRRLKGALHAAFIFASSTSCCTGALFPPFIRPSVLSPCTSQASLPRRPAGRSSEGDGWMEVLSESSLSGNERGALGGDVQRA